MEKLDKKDKLGVWASILCAIAGILLLTELIYHATKSEAQETQTIQYEEPMSFNIDNLINLETDSLNMGYDIVYHVDSTDSQIHLFTSLIEGDYLKVYMDCLDLYSYNQSYEDIDQLRNYLLNNSRIKYMENQWFKGYVWIYDACPMYRFPYTQN